MGGERTPAGKLVCFCAAGLIFFLSAGCTTSKKEFTLSSRQEVSPPKVKQEELAKLSSEDLLRAKKLFDLGDYAGALKENQKVLSRSPKNDSRDRALFNMGLIYACIENPQRDSGKALHFFKTVLKEFPQSPLADEAKVLAGVLQENEALSQVIEKIKQADIAVEEKKREKAR